MKWKMRLKGSLVQRELSAKLTEGLFDKTVNLAYSCFMKVKTRSETVLMPS